MPKCTDETVQFGRVGRRVVEAAFDGGDIVSDGGVLLLKQRLRPMRGFKQLASGDSLTRGHALVQNLRNGFSTLTERIPRPLRLAAAWPQLARAI